MAKEPAKTLHESYMRFEVVEAENGFVLQVSIPDRECIGKLVVWQIPVENELEAFAHFLCEFRDHFGPVSKKQQIFVAVGPRQEDMH